MLRWLLKSFTFSLISDLPLKSPWSDRPSKKFKLILLLVLKFTIFSLYSSRMRSRILLSRCFSGSALTSLFKFKKYHVISTTGHWEYESFTKMFPKFLSEFILTKYKMTTTWTWFFSMNWVARQTVYLLL